MFHEAQALRNEWAHQKLFGTDDTFRAETIDRLLRACHSPDDAGEAVLKIEMPDQNSQDEKSSKLSELGIDPELEEGLFEDAKEYTRILGREISPLRAALINGIDFDEKE